MATSATMEPGDGQAGMLTYQDLCEAQARSEERAIASGREIRRQLPLFVDGYADFIDAPRSTYEADDGSLREHVRLAQVLSAAAPREASVRGDGAGEAVGLDEHGMVWFELELALRIDGGAGSTSIHRFRIGMKLVRDRIFVFFPSSRKTISAERSRDAYDYVEAYLEINRAVLESMESGFPLWSRQ
ncbi:hypothetical protein EDD84_23320 [Burkholderia gladioli]|nr:hypothetical protein EDD84_23320 [Burkholderia gladioli]